MDTDADMPLLTTEYKNLGRVITEQAARYQDEQHGNQLTSLATQALRNSITLCCQHYVIQQAETNLNICLLFKIFLNQKDIFWTEVFKKFFFVDTCFFNQD